MDVDDRVKMCVFFTGVSIICSALNDNVAGMGALILALAWLVVAIAMPERE